MVYEHFLDLIAVSASMPEASVRSAVSPTRLLVLKQHPATAQYCDNRHNQTGEISFLATSASETFCLSYFPHLLGGHFRTQFENRKSS